MVINYHYIISITVHRSNFRLILHGSYSTDENWAIVDSVIGRGFKKPF